MKTRGIPEVLTPDERERMLGRLEPDRPSQLRNLAIIRLLLNTGLRAREARELQWKNLDLSTGRVKVRGKGGRERVLWLADDDLALLKTWARNQGTSSNLVFTSLDGGKPLCARWLRKMVKRVAAQAGLGVDIHPHTLRHTFATDLLRQTKNLRLVQKALGHSSVVTTTIYTHIVDEELEEAMKGLRK